MGPRDGVPALYRKVSVWKTIGDRIGKTEYGLHSDVCRQWIDFWLYYIGIMIRYLALDGAADVYAWIRGVGITYGNAGKQAWDDALMVEVEAILRGLCNAASDHIDIAVWRGLPGCEK